MSKPTPKGEVEGDVAGGCPGTHPRGKLRGLAGRLSWPTPRGEVERCGHKGGV